MIGSRSSANGAFRLNTAQVPLAVHWRFETANSLEPPPIADITRWLTIREMAALDSFRFEKRRREWLLGRLVAKRLLCDLLQERFMLEVDPLAVEVWRRPNGAPLVLSADDLLPWARGSPLPLDLSLSHSHGAVLCGAFWFGRPSASAARLGVDVEQIEQRSPDLFRDYFTEAEHRYSEEGQGGTRDQRATLIWSGKESTLKALGKGLTVDTRSVTCLPTPGEPSSDALELVPTAGWHPLRVLVPRWSPTVSRSLGYWQTQAGFILTVVVIWSCVETEADTPG